MGTWIPKWLHGCKKHVAACGLVDAPGRTTVKAVARIALNWDILTPNYTTQLSEMQ